MSLPPPSTSHPTHIPIGSKIKSYISPYHFLETTFSKEPTDSTSNSKPPTKAGDDSTYITPNINEISKAIDSEDIKRLNVLIEQLNGESNINRVFLNSNETNLLNMAMHKNKMGVFTHLLSLKDIDVNSPNEMGMPSLHFAAHISDRDYINELLKHGANINSKDVNGNTPLHVAVIASHSEKSKPRFDVVKFLLDNDADINAKNNDNDTALDIATELSEYSITQEIYEDVNKIKAILNCKSNGISCTVMGGRASRKSKTRSKRSHKKIRRRRRSKKQLSKK
jgi:ankyrin repeat protein